MCSVYSTRTTAKIRNGPDFNMVNFHDPKIIQADAGRSLHTVFATPSPAYLSFSLDVPIFLLYVIIPYGRALNDPSPNLQIPVYSMYVSLG